MKLFLLILCMLPVRGLAYKNDSLLAGVGYYSQNAFGKTTKSADSSPSLLGTASYPFYVRYEMQFAYEWYFSPQLNYTLFPRESAGGSAKITMLHVQFPFGKNFDFGYNGQWDWSVGPGILQYTTKGAGGSVVLNNGTGSNTFALPGDSTKVQVWTFNMGVGMSLDSSRFGADLISEGFLSDKRSFSLMLSYAYRFGGSGGSW